jgi:hypothetical protein
MMPVCGLKKEAGSRFAAVADLFVGSASSFGMMRTKEEIIKMGPLAGQYLLDIVMGFYNEVFSKFAPGNSGLIGDQDDRDLLPVKSGDRFCRLWQKLDILELA